MTRYAKVVGTKATPQTEPVLGKDQVQNNAGGFVFALDKWAQARRFVVLGCENNTYYCTEHELVRDNAKSLEACIKDDPVRLVNMLVEISDGGLAPKNEPAIFALAMTVGLASSEGRKAALEALPKICRIGTHLFQFVSSVKAFRGLGRSVRRAISKWLNDKPAEKLAYQVIKYQQRDGWGFRDLLRLTHPVPSTPQHDAIYKWVVDGLHQAPPDKDNKVRVKDGKDQAHGKAIELLSVYHPTEQDRVVAVDAVEKDWVLNLPPQIHAFEKLKEANDLTHVCNVIRANNMPRECVPTQWQTKPEVWDALLESMPMTAMVRCLNRMTACGLIAPMSKASNHVIAQLANQELITKSRIHPISMLSALMTYQQGHGVKGKLTWEPVSQVVDALDQAFYLSFKNVEATGKRIMLALDVSGSMTRGDIAGVPGLSPRQASAAMAMVTARTEKNWVVTGFTCAGQAPQSFIGQWTDRGYAEGLSVLPISPRQRLEDIVKYTESLPFGGTDCAQPMLYALKKGMELDAFIVYTDSETWANDQIQPFQALQQYRQKMGINAKLIVVGMTATGFTIADPSDAGMLDLVGFDSSAPQMMSEFITGRI